MASQRALQPDMDAAQWIATFRIAHQKARRGELVDEADARKYREMCDELARSLIASQNLTVPAGVPPRRALKVAHVFPIELSNLYKTTTTELSCTGFTAVLAANLREGDPMAFVLTLARGEEPLSGLSTVVSALKHASGTSRVSCTFTGLDEARLVRLERALFDAALARFQA